MPREHSMSQPSRRRFLGGTGMLLLAAGCAPTSGEASEGPARTVKHEYGTTEISGMPRRVVTVGLTDQDYVIALGVTPVATREWFGQQPGALWPWARARIGDDQLPEVLPRQELDFERIAALRPDLILGVNSGLTKSEYATLSDIAPTVAQPAEFPDYGVPWQEMTRIIGTALGKPGQAGQLIPDIEHRFETARNKHPEFADATGLLATSISGAVYVYAEGPAPRFLRSLGFELPPAAAKLFSDGNRAPVKLSMERLDVLEADLLMLGVYGDVSTSLVTEPLYQRLRNVRRGRDVVLPQQSTVNGAVSFSSVLSLPLALDELVPRFADAVDGTPATAVEPVATP